MNAVTMIRLENGTDQCHRHNCQDLAKVEERNILDTYENINDAITAWNAHDEDGWTEWVKVMPCTKAGA